MENKTTDNKVIKRKKFFASLSVGVLGYTVFNQFPFSLFKNKTASAGKIKVQINPLAVTRKNSASKNSSLDKSVSINSSQDKVGGKNA